MGALVDDLSRPEAYGGGDPPARIDTHVSRVFLRPAEVFKIKRPVDLGFLDFRTLESRRAACEAEVRLNAPLAPGVYLGVVPVRRGADGVHRLAGDGEIVDFAVHMRRLPDERRADVLLAAGELKAGDVERIATVVAGFHGTARADARTAAFGLPEVIRRNVEENFAQTRELIGRYLDPAEAAEVERWQLGFLEREGHRFHARAAAGRVREGHGDLRLEHVYLLPDRLVIVDCIEFNDRFRHADVCADLSFLSMDLAWHGRVDLGETLLAAYARETGDYDLYPLADFYESYRAFVRGKVSAILAADPDAPAAARERGAAEARRYFLLSIAAERPPLIPPSLIAMGGPIGSGKSTLAGELGRALSAPVIDTDRTRKQLLGIPPARAVPEAPFQGAYDPAVSERVYAELLRRGALVLSTGRPVILDASFRAAAHRTAARELAARQGVRFRFLECRAPVATLRARLEQRRGGVSDGRPAILDDFLRGWEAVTELEEAEHVIVDTTRPLASNVAELREALAPA